MKTALVLVTLLGAASLGFACACCNGTTGCKKSESCKPAATLPAAPQASNNCCQPGQTPSQDKQPGGELKAMG